LLLRSGVLDTVQILPRLLSSAQTRGLRMAP
jgi:hypothetical protein